MEVLEKKAWRVSGMELNLLKGVQTKYSCIEIDEEENIILKFQSRCFNR